MKAIIPQNKLEKGLKIVKRISQKSLTLPILDSVLIKAKENFLNLRTTDLEISINWWDLAKVERKGSIAIPVGVLSNFVSFLPDRPVRLESKENILEISCENYKSKIKGQKAEDFPIIPKIKEGKSFSVKTRPFCKALAKVSDIAAPSLARPGISGIYFSLGKNFLKLVATDSFRLGEKSFGLEKFEGQTSFILPQKAAKALINIFGEREKETTIVFSPNQILFKSPILQTPHPQIHLTSKLIEAEYPDYQEIIPKEFKTQLILDKNEFLNQIKSASLFSGKINEVKFKIEPQRKEMEILSRNPELGDYKSKIGGKMKGELVEVSFNHKFLSGGASKIDSSKIVFELNGDKGPGVLKSIEDKTFLYIVMPIKPS